MRWISFASRSRPAIRGRLAAELGGPALGLSPALAVGGCFGCRRRLGGRVLHLAGHGLLFHGGHGRLVLLRRAARPRTRRCPGSGRAPCARSSRPPGRRSGLPSPAGPGRGAATRRSARPCRSISSLMSSSLTSIFSTSAIFCRTKCSLRASSVLLQHVLLQQALPAADLLLGDAVGSHFHDAAGQRLARLPHQQVLRQLPGRRRRRSAPAPARGPTAAAWYSSRRCRSTRISSRNCSGGVDAEVCAGTRASAPADAAS